MCSLPPEEFQKLIANREQRVLVQALRKWVSKPDTLAYYASTRPDLLSMLRISIRTAPAASAESSENPGPSSTAMEQQPVVNDHAPQTGSATVAAT